MVPVLSDCRTKPIVRSDSMNQLRAWIPSRVSTLTPWGPDASSVEALVVLDAVMVNERCAPTGLLFIDAGP